MIDLLKSSGAGFWYQRNNKIKPNIACNVTSMCNCLDILHQTKILDNIPEQYKKISDQPEDWLYEYLCKDPDMQTFLKRSHGTSEIPAPEWADCLIKGVNTLAKQNITWFDSKLEKDEIICDLHNNKPVNVSTTLYGGGHRISIIGAQNENATDNSFELLIADPLLRRAEGGVRFIKWSEFLKIRKEYGIRFNV